MSIKAVLFDLDGTLLSMDQDNFIKTYMGALVRFHAPRGYDPEILMKAIWKGTGAMLKNDGSRSNEEVFWNAFCKHYGEDSRKDEPIFDEYYRTEFQSAKAVCGYTEKAAKLDELNTRVCVEYSAFVDAVFCLGYIAQFDEILERVTVTKRR
jgi:phosphoglycolate phosphatase-like HAD superfamily hydrolase